MTLGGWLQREDLTPSEAAVVVASVTGDWWDPSEGEPGDAADGLGWPESRTVRAEVIAQLLTGAGHLLKSGDVEEAPRAVRLRGARLMGTLDLRDVELLAPLHLDTCWLDVFGKVMFDNAVASALTLEGCYLSAGVSARGVSVRGDFSLRGCTVLGVSDLTGARIDGAVMLSACTLIAPKRTVLSCQLAQIGGGLDARGRFSATGRVALTGATVRGSVQLSGAHLRNPGGVALAADHLRVENSLYCNEGRARGEDVHFIADGLVTMVGAHIGSELNFNGAHLKGAGGVAFLGTRLSVGSSLWCAGRSVQGAPPDCCRTAGVKTVPFSSHGTFFLSGAEVGSQLNLGGTFDATTGTAIELQGIRVGRELSLLPEAVRGVVNATFATATTLVDDLAGPVYAIHLRGFRYAQLVLAGSEESPVDRIEWLRRDPSGYLPQPYAQLAGVYRSQGDDAAARSVLVAGELERHRRHAGWTGLGSRVWSRFLWATVGYGYRPWLGALWLLAVVAAGWIAIALTPAAEFRRQSGAPPFNSFLYTLDAVVPFFDFGYAKWVPVDLAQGVTVLLTLAGWVLATAVVSAIGSLLKRGD